MKRLDCMLDMVILPAGDAFGMIEKALNAPGKALLSGHFIIAQNRLH